MVSKNTILISVHKDIKKELDNLKLHPNLSYNDVVVELISFWRENHKSPKPEAIAEIPIVAEISANAELLAEKICYFCNAVEVIDEKLGKITQHEPSCSRLKTNTSIGDIKFYPPSWTELKEKIPRKPFQGFKYFVGSVEDETDGRS